MYLFSTPVQKKELQRHKVERGDDFEEKEKEIEKGEKDDLLLAPNTIHTVLCTPE